MEIKTYDQMEIEILQCSKNYEALLNIACSMTMKRIVEQKDISEKLVSFLIASGHTSVLEHLIITCKVTGVSRSFLAQITRHRIMSPTSASQHYQDYRDYPIVLSPNLSQADRETLADACSVSYKTYVTLINKGVPTEEARQVLPNAAAVNMLMTWNARSLLNFFRQRCCNRNVEEMRIFANKLRETMMAEWPLVIQETGPACHTGKCDQGHMQCKDKIWRAI